ncbi:hypothetical protein GJ744_000624 [Endocarpon pusillum]|uniref:Uncharacterized protein n=1 Tax=Endocarpon pusillum TaxID=364733 RepID=A0A8H7E1T0_9EURO|nr:hypothetical protein GJ744_000624 [Endocarpon pusillum]
MFTLPGSAFSSYCRERLLKHGVYEAFAPAEQLRMLCDDSNVPTAAIEFKELFYYRLAAEMASSTNIYHLHRRASGIRRPTDSLHLFRDVLSLWSGR